jgi:K+-transporting ATPase ATPase C chain
MTIRRDLVNAALGNLLATTVCGILFPLLIVGIGQIAFPGNSGGQLVYRGHTLVGSKLIGQAFVDAVIDRRTGKVEMSDGQPVTVPDPRFFQTRPSGTTPADNAASSSFANLGPNSRLTEQTLAANIRAYIALNGRYQPHGLTAARIPVDAVDTSASGIDPDISVANAHIQARRVAVVDHLPLSRVDALAARFTGGRGLGFSGEPTVNVLELNLAIDSLTGEGR